MGASPHTPGIYRIDPNPEIFEIAMCTKRSAQMTLRLGLGSWGGARVASQHRPIFRTGRKHSMQKLFGKESTRKKE